MHLPTYQCTDLVFTRPRGVVPSSPHFLFDQHPFPLIYTGLLSYLCLALGIMLPSQSSCIRVPHDGWAPRNIPLLSYMATVGIIRSITPQVGRQPSMAKSSFACHGPMRGRLPGAPPNACVPSQRCPHSLRLQRRPEHPIKPGTWELSSSPRRWRGSPAGGDRPSAGGRR